MLLFAALLFLGAGCVSSSAPPAPPSSADDAPAYANPPNCEKSGGTTSPDGCDCPDGYAPDPAGFCLDAAGAPGGEMAPKP